MKKIIYGIFALCFVVLVANAQVGAVLYGSQGLKDKEFNLFLKTLHTIGYEVVDKNANIHKHYAKKYHEQTLDALSFFTITNEKMMRNLLIQNPKFGAFSPFNLLLYKRTNEDKTWYGHLNAQSILEMIGEKDTSIEKTYKQIHHALDTLIKQQMHPSTFKNLSYETLPRKTMLEMVKTFERPEEIAAFVEAFQEKHDEVFEKKHYIIAGYIDFKEAYRDAGLEFDDYDAYWISSLCHFRFSNSVFNRGAPQAGIFAPCSVYFYIKKGSHKLHVGMARLENWVSIAGIKEQKKIDAMQKMDKEIVGLFEELGFVDAHVKPIPVTLDVKEESILDKSITLIKSMLDRLGFTNKPTKDI